MPAISVSRMAIFSSVGELVLTNILEQHVAHPFRHFLSSGK
jgi:hypothetical protein